MSRLTLQEDGLFSEQTPIMQTLTPDEREILALELSEPYSDGIYQYDKLGRIYLDMRHRRGLFTSSELGGLPYNSTMYLQAIKDVIMFVVVSYSIKMLMIYFFSIWGSSSNPQFGNGLIDYILIPASRLGESSKFRWIDAYFSEPLTIIIACIYVFYLVQKMEERITGELQSHSQNGMLTGCYLDNIDINSTDKDISASIDARLKRTVEKKVTLVYDSLGIESMFEKYTDLLIEVKGQEKDEPPAKLRELKDAIIKTQNRLQNEKDNLRLPVVIVVFNNYEDNLDFIVSEAGITGRRLTDIGKSAFNKVFMDSIDFAPDPAQIDWDAFKPYTLKSKVIHFGMCVLFFIILPAITYFLQFTFCMQFTKVFTFNQNAKIGNSFFFRILQLLVSVVFSQCCSWVIDKYYARVYFKTRIERAKSKFYFYNFYFMINQIAADFYGVVSAGIQAVLKQNAQSAIINNQAYIFSAAFKTGQTLMLSPFIQMFIYFLPNMMCWAKVKFFPGKSKMIDAVRRDLPKEHDISNMASFIVQCVFYVSFFSDFLMPALVAFPIVGLLIFYHVERKLLGSMYSLQANLNLYNLKMIYVMMFWANMIGDFLSVGNSSLLLEYFTTFNITVFKQMLIKALGLGAVLLGLIFAMYISLNYGDFVFKKRLLSHLVKLRVATKSTPEEASRYERRMPLSRAINSDYSV
jgi:hypothetical protein